MLQRRAMTILAALEDEVAAARDVHPPERYVSTAIASFYNRSVGRDT